MRYLPARLADPLLPRRAHFEQSCPRPHPSGSPASDARPSLPALCP